MSPDFKNVWASVFIAALNCSYKKKMKKKPQVKHFFLHDLNASCEK